MADDERVVPGAGGGAATDELADLVATLRPLIATGRRHLVGITGAPGAGKSTLAEALVVALAPNAVLVSMDGFHLRDDELQRLGRYERKGASDTFDAAGYVHLLRRLKAAEEPVVYAPVFDRSLEESIGSAVPVPAEVPLVITEGNYLLVDGPPWGEVASLLTECWYVEPGEEQRLSQLIGRHLQFGRSHAEAVERSHGSDGRNALLVAASKAKATRIVHGPVRV